MAYLERLDYTIKSKNNMKIQKLFFILFGLLLLTGCTSQNIEEMKVEKTNMYIDESFKLLFDTAIPTFESQNEFGELSPIYTSELEAIEAFKNGTTNTICVARELTEKETAYLKSKNIEFSSHYLGKDGVTLIVNPENEDSFYTLQQLKDILNGKDTVWRTSGKQMEIVIDQSNSSNFYFLSNLIDNQTIKAKISAAKSNEEVMKLVRERKDVLGVIGSNWVSDERDSTHLQFKEGIKVCSIAANEYAEYFQPYQAYLYNDIYPLTRRFYLLNKAKTNSIATRLTHFMINQQKGQLLIYKSGLIPATMYEREIQIVVEK